MRSGIPLQAFPLAGRQLEDQPRRMRRDALDHVAQIDERIDLQVVVRKNTSPLVEICKVLSNFKEVPSTTEGPLA